MNRRALLGALWVVSLAAAPLAAAAQPAGVARIGVLAPTTCSHPNYQALREGLRALGYVEGTTIPIVMGAVGDPVTGGVVTSLARPGANITGLTLMTAEMNAKRLEFLKAAVPGSTRVAVLTNPGNPSSAPGTRETEAAGRALGLAIPPSLPLVADEVIQ